MKSKLIDDTLAKIEISVQEGDFIDVEKAKVELKDLSTGNDWKSLKETICAYLNTEGGFVIGGVRERNKTYKITGFNRNNESSIIDLQSKFFKNDEGQLIDLSDNIHFDYFNLLNNEVVVIAVYSLSDDKKFVSFDGEYFERKLTQDKKIVLSKLRQQKEYKTEIEHAKELSIISDTTIEDFNLNKINAYIQLLNQEVKNETLKSSFEDAKPFLFRHHFLKKEGITTLGMLVCGAEPFHFLGARAEVNCYYDTEYEVSKDIKILRNDVISLMEDTNRYVWGNIRKLRTIKNGGETKPEYPEVLVREIINNALAHRDYTVDGFTTVTVEPGKWIEVKNPGSFKEKIKLTHTENGVEIRRIIPGIPESKNPKLASVLKVFSKIENQGRGMAALVNATFDNAIDVPYYELKANIISLRIPSGTLVDNSIELWLNGFEKYITYKLKDNLTSEHKQVLAYFYKSENLNHQRKYTILLSESNNHLQVIHELKSAQLIYEHHVSTEENPIYILDRTLMKTNFQDELIDLIGDEFITLDKTAKDALNLIYQYSKYNKTGLKPADITPETYKRQFGKIIEPKQYETLGRKVRRICKQFQNDGFLVKDTKKAYRINFEYQKEK